MCVCVCVSVRIYPPAHLPVSYSSLSIQAIFNFSPQTSKQEEVCQTVKAPGESLRTPTIIFSNRARIAFSDVILEESSSNSADEEEEDQSQEEEGLR